SSDDCRELGRDGQPAASLVAPDVGVARRGTAVAAHVVRDAVDERHLAERLDVDLVVGHLRHARPGRDPHQELRLADAPPVGERAGEIGAQVLVVPRDVGLDERVDVVRVQTVQLADGFRFFSASLSDRRIRSLDHGESMPNATSINWPDSDIWGHVRIRLVSPTRSRYIWAMDRISAVVTTGIYCRPGCGPQPPASGPACAAVRTAGRSPSPGRLRSSSAAPCAWSWTAASIMRARPTSGRASVSRPATCAGSS